MAPPMIHAINSSHLPLDNLLSSLRYVGVGGALIDGGAMNRLRSHLRPEAKPTQAWGMTEIGSATLFRWAETDDVSSIGRWLPGYEASTLR